MRLTDKQCDEFRRLPCSFNDMVRAIHEAGRGEAERLAAEVAALTAQSNVLDREINRLNRDAKRDRFEEASRS